MKGINLVVLSLFAGMVVMGTSSAAEEKGLVGWWKLDDGQGDVANDSSGFSNHGALKNGPLWVSGRIGGALHFANTDETNIYVDIPNNPMLENLQEADYTVAAWVKPDRLPPGTDNTPAYGILVKPGLAHRTGLRPGWSVQDAAPSQGREQHAYSREIRPQSSRRMVSRGRRGQQDRRVR